MSHLSTELEEFLYRILTAAECALVAGQTAPLAEMHDYLAAYICDGTLPKEGAYAEGAEAITHATRLRSIAYAVARLPHAGEGAGPSLELGESAEAADLLVSIAEGQDPSLSFNRTEPGYAAVCIGGLWVGASRPKTGGAT